MHQFNIYFDGGCKPNPGQCYGSYEIDAPSLHVSRRGRVPFNVKGSLIQFGFGTNNLAEYWAMTAALKRLYHESKHGWLAEEGFVPSRFTLTIHSDSKLLVEQMNGRWKIKLAHMVEAYDEARLVLKEFGHWKLIWKPRNQNVVRFGH